MSIETCTTLVVGGAGGLGEAIVYELLSRGANRIIVVDRNEPSFANPKVEWIQFDLAVNSISDLSSCLYEVQALIVTAGVGRLDCFETFDATEIEKTIRINATAVIGLLSMASKKLIMEKPFYAAVLTSIAALVSSPLYAVYSASKAALSRYVEAVNAELAGRGLPNRVTEVSPGRIEGTAFHGDAPSGPEQLMPLASQILDSMLNRVPRLVPNDSVYNEVLARYHADPAAFGVSSYRYKMEHAKLEHARNVAVGYLSGTFDLFHVGHLNLLERANAMCDWLVVGVHGSGAWKGKETFIPLEERKAMLRGCRYVDEVIDAPDEDDDAWEIVQYDRLFVGSDYQGTARFDRYERELATKGVRIIYFPYTQGTSSTQIRDAVLKSI